MIDKIQAQPGVIETGNMYLSHFGQEFSDETWNLLENGFFKDESVIDCIKFSCTDEQYDYNACMNDYRKFKTMAGSTYGMGKWLQAN